MKAYDQKTKSIKALWHKLISDARKEIKRSFMIWKETFSKFKLQKFRLKRTLWKKFFKQASIAVNAWKNHNSYNDSQVRLNLLAQSYGYQQQLAILFRSFHMQSQDNKRKRL
jgi:hypothetical protein